MLRELVESIKQHEGFRGMPYNDSLGYATIGYGTKLPLTKTEAEWLLKFRLTKMIDELEKNIPYLSSLPEPVQLVLMEMAYQLGVPKLMQFHRMFKAIENRDWNGMIREMRDSKWYRQTPNRVKELIKRIKDGL